MSLHEGRFIRCACGRLYKFMAMYVGDQSVCPHCRRSLEQEYREQQARDGESADAD